MGCIGARAGATAASSAMEPARVRGHDLSPSAGRIRRRAEAVQLSMACGFDTHVLVHGVTDVIAETPGAHRFTA